jgi:uncharacterized membrane protein
MSEQEKARKKAIDKIIKQKPKQTIYQTRLKVIIISWYTLGIILMIPGMYYNDTITFCFGAGFFFLATAFIGLNLLWHSAGYKI